MSANQTQITENRKQKTENRPLRVALIGGQGQMGQWFLRFFAAQGLEVLVADRDTSPTPEEAASQAEVVILSVPIPQVEAVVRQIAPHLRPEAALMDLTSIKQEPMAAMLAHFPGEVVGTHPLFGPGEVSIVGRTVVLCPGRGEKWLNWMQDLLLQAGARVQVTTPAEHDRLMSLVQGLAHFMLIALGATIRRLGLDPQDLENFSTPTFRSLHNLTRHLLSQDAGLYACIQLQNQANLTALANFEEAVDEILHFIQSKDAPGLVRFLEETRLIYQGKGDNKL